MRIAVIIALAIGAHFLMQWVEVYAATLPKAQQGLLLGSTVTVVVVLYAILIAIPFVPGIEIGVSLMMMRGPDVAPFVYMGTVSGLMTAFLVGRYVSYDWLHKILSDLHLRRASAYVARIKLLTRQERVDLLRSRLPARVGAWALNFRYLSVALLVNLPGNALIGGGGGICLLAGLSRLFSPAIMGLTIVLAVSPVPILVWFFGVDILGAK